MLGPERKKEYQITVDRLRRKISSLSNSTFLKEIKRNKFFISNPSLTLLRNPIYRDIYDRFYELIHHI